MKDERVGANGICKSTTTRGERDNVRKFEGEERWRVEGRERGCRKRAEGEDICLESEGEGKGEWLTTILVKRM